MTYQELCSFDTLWTAYHRARRCKRGKKSTAPFEYSAIEELLILSKSLLQGTHQPDPLDAFYAPAKEKEETFGADDLGSSAYRAYSDQRASDYRSMADDLTSSPIFQGMDDETRDKVLKAAYDLADKSALADHSDGQYEVSTKWMAQADDAEAQGIEPWEYVLFHTAYNEMEGTKDADGKTVKGEAKSDHVREWLEDFSGLTDEQRAFLWGTVYTSEW